MSVAVRGGIAAVIVTGAHFKPLIIFALRLRVPEWAEDFIMSHWRVR